MAREKDRQKKFDTCLEDIPCAQVMHKLLGKKGIGSLCAEVMKKMRKQDRYGSSLAGAEQWRKMFKGFGGKKTETTAKEKEDSHDYDK